MNTQEKYSVIVAILQSIRDNRPIDNTGLEEMLNLVYKERKGCTKENTQDSTLLDNVHRIFSTFDRN